MNFDFEITKELSSSKGGGIEIIIKRSIDKKQIKAIIPSIKKLRVEDFEAYLEKNLKTMVFCNVTKWELTSLIAEKLHQYRERGGKTYKQAERIGRQEDGYWVFSAKHHFDPKGNLITPEESGYVYDPSLGKTDKLKHPTIQDPNPNALSDLIEAIGKFHGPAHVESAIFVLGWAAATMQYETIIELEQRFPILNLFGEAGGGKTTKVSNGLSLAGWSGESGSFSKTSESALYEHLQTCGSLPLLFDDPEKKILFDELTKRLYNRKPRMVRENCQTPNTSLAITTNHIIGDGNPAVSSRLVHVPVPIVEGNREYWPELVEARSQASGAIGSIIGIGYDAEAVKKIEKQLLAYLPKAHTRVAWNIALFTWYGMEVAKLGKFDPQRILKYAIEVLCPAANSMDSKCSSLAKFLEGLSGLKAQSYVGEWDCRIVNTKKFGRCLAVSMASVWSIYEKVYNPPFSRKIVENLVAENGGVLQSTQRFYRSSDELKAYYRNLLQATTPEEREAISAPPEVSRRCILIPLDFLTKLGSSWNEDIKNAIDRPLDDKDLEEIDEVISTVQDSEDFSKEYPTMTIVDPSSGSTIENQLDLDFTPTVVEAVEAVEAVETIPNDTSGAAFKQGDISNAVDVMDTEIETQITQHSTPQSSFTPVTSGLQKNVTGHNPDSESVLPLSNSSVHIVTEKDNLEDLVEEKEVEIKNLVGSINSISAKSVNDVNEVKISVETIAPTGLESLTAPCERDVTLVNEPVTFEKLKLSFWATNLLPLISSIEDPETTQIVEPVMVEPVMVEPVTVEPVTFEKLKLSFWATNLLPLISSVDRAASKKSDRSTTEVRSPLALELDELEELNIEFKVGMRVVNTVSGQLALITAINKLGGTITVKLSDGSTRCWYDNLVSPEPGTITTYSRIIELIDAQIERLGWSIAQAKEFLQSHFNVRSRHKLSD
ncbi:MAG: hypothetical protein ACFBSE_25750, partial [Prochloraceae cyanobacterium]